MNETKHVTFDQLAVDSGINPLPDAPCPNCGSDYDISRGCEVGISVRGGARLCSECINESVPGLAAVLDLVTDLQFTIEEAEQPALLALASRGLIRVAAQTLLHDIDWPTKEGASEGISST